MNIAWVLDAWESEGRLHSASASIRYRGLLPAQALAAKGHKNTYIALQTVYDAAFELGTHDVLVMGKLLPTSDLDGFAHQTTCMLKTAEAARSAGIRLIVDVSDNHFTHAKLGEYWRSLAKLANVCVVGSQPLAEAAREFTTARVEVVGDPIGSPAGQPKVYRRTPPQGALARIFRAPRPPEPVRAVWYGHQLNFGAMAQWSKKLRTVVALTVVTSRSPEMDRFVAAYNAQGSPPMRFVEWSEEAQWSAVAEADLVLLPSDPNDPRKSVKTGNRLTDAINAGRFVVASALPAYEPFRDYCDLTTDPVTAVARYVDDPDAALDKVTRGQVAVREQCGLEAIAAQWLKAMQ